MSETIMCPQRKVVVAGLLFCALLAIGVHAEEIGARSRSTPYSAEVIPPTDTLLLERLRTRVSGEVEKLRGKSSDSLPAERNEGNCEGYDGILYCGYNINNGFLGGFDCILTARSYIDLYELRDVAAGQKVTITVTSTVSSPILIALHDASANVVATDTRTGTATLTYESPRTTWYAVSVAFVTPLATGAYRLTVSCSAGTAPPAPATCQYTSTLSCSSRNLIGSVSPGACRLATDTFADVYKFDAQEGQTIEIEVNADFDLYLGFDSYDSATKRYLGGIYRKPGRDGKVSYTATETGEVEVWIASEKPNVSGGYLLNVSCPEVAPCRRRAVAK